MQGDGLLATLDRWGRAALPGVVLLFFVLLTLAPLRAPYLSDALPLLPALAVYQYSLVTPERMPGLLLLVAGVLLDLLLGGPGAPVGISALGFIVIRALVVTNRRYLAAVAFLFQWMGFALLIGLFVLMVWSFTAVFTWTRLPLVPGAQQFVVVLVLYPLIAPLLGRPSVRDPLNVGARGGPTGSEP